MVKITDLTLRDGHQSLIATRMRTRDMLPILEKMDEVGFFSLEVWGGATFDACIRYLNEDPWERLREIKKRVENTPLQMLLRGQNLVGYRHYPDDIVEKFVIKSIENGIDIIRIFDALNDIRNMEFAIKVAKKHDAHVQGAFCYTISPVHTIEKFVELAKKLEELGCDSICIKDMAGLISPKDAYELVKSLKKELSIPIDLHSHTTSGMAPIAHYTACEAGVDILDTCFSAFAWGTSHPPTESIVASLKGTKYDTGLDLELLAEIGEYFRKVREKYKGLFSDHSQIVDVNVLVYQVPGGMLSNLVSQLKEQNALEKLDEVLKEVPKVREDLGYPPLVTPTSQIVGTQAVMNVLLGERYKVVLKEVKDYVKGLYGKPPAPIKPEIVKKILGDEKPIDVRPADLLEPEYEKRKIEAEKLGIVKKEEDILTYALFPQIAVKFLRGEIKEEPIPEPCREEKKEEGIPTEFRVEVDGEIYHVKVEPVGGYITEIKKAEAKKELKNAVKSPLQGLIVKIKVKVGDKVKKGDVIAVLEAMKMQNDINAPWDGVVKEILVSEGSSVNAGDPIMIIEP